MPRGNGLRRSRWVKYGSCKADRRPSCVHEADRPRGRRCTGGAHAARKTFARGRLSGRRSCERRGRDPHRRSRPSDSARLRSQGLLVTTIDGVGIGPQVSGWPITPGRSTICAQRSTGPFRQTAMDRSGCGDPEQEFISDGVAEDVITALSRYPSLFVIARNSSFTYKGRVRRAPQVAPRCSRHRHRGLDLRSSRRQG